MRRFSFSFCHLRSDARGSVGIMFAAAAALTLGFIGMAVDYGRALQARTALQAAADAAVLSVSRDAMSTQSELETLANSSFASNIPSGLGVGPITKTFNLTGTKLTYTAEASLSTTFMTVLDIGQLAISVESKAQRRTNGTEIVIALDTTGSMGFGSSWTDAKAAMVEMLGELDELSTNQDDFYATFFPFADRVNVGMTRAESWLSVASPAESKWGKLKKENNNTRYTAKGCLEPRDENINGNPNTLTDKAPGTLGFLPTAENHYASYLARKNYFTCPADEVMGPTTDIASFQTAIEQLPLKGTGRFDLAMAWAFRMVSPNWQGLWDVPGYPAAYGERRKIVVFVSDAYTEAYRYEAPNQTTNTHNTVIGHNQGSIKGFENFVDVCTQMKDKGIEIHTIYVNGNGNGVPYMKSCATTEERHYHGVNDISELRTALANIASSVVAVSLSH